ncbi:MAG: hypothetical protein ABIQ05_01600 [Candidatus Limnocylindria bacterium]
MTGPARVQIHVRPRLRPIGDLLLPDWLAITIGSHVWAWRRLNDAEMAHELAHVSQWRSHGARLPLLYLVGALRAWRAGGDWYRDNPFERAARAAERSDGAP